jgi:hypothetical protein
VSALAVVSIDGYTLAALIVILVALLVALALTRRLFRDRGIRIARMGVFIERERFPDGQGEPTPGEEPTVETSIPEESRQWPRRTDE